MESAALEGGYRAQKAFFDGCISQAHEVDSDAQGNVDFDSDGDGRDPQAFGTMDVDKHGLF